MNSATVAAIIASNAAMVTASNSNADAAIGPLLLLMILGVFLLALVVILISFNF